MMDVSGSMGTFEKYVSRAFYYWMVRFLRTRYDNVEIAFVAHHTEAKEVTEEEFFTRGESGGTKASSAYQLALELVEQRYRPEDWNIYPFHFSDGDNWPSDNEHLPEAGAASFSRNPISLATVRFGRAAIRHQSTLMQTLERLDTPKYIPVTIADKADVYPALWRLLRPDKRQGGALLRWRSEEPYMQLLRDPDLDLLSDSIEDIWDVAGGTGAASLPDALRDCARLDHVRVRLRMACRAGFSHWTHGKMYQMQKTMYDYGLSKIYELVINTNPCWAFLLEIQHVLHNEFVVAHVLGHSDFFANNAYYARTTSRR